MIKFFRNFRKSHLSKNRFGKYLLYAIGEIILVVIGILIALQVNNWNEEKREVRYTKTYVDNLIEEIKKDTIMYADQIRAAKLKNEFCKEINDIIFQNKAITDTSRFIVNLQIAGRLIVPTLTDNTYKDLVSTGNLKLIKDKHSIAAIREYYSNPLKWWNEDYKNQLVNGYLPIVVDAIPMHLHEQILTNEIGDTFQDFNEKSILRNSVDFYTREDIEVILKALRNNEDFRFNLKRITRSHLVQINILNLSANNARSLLNILEKWKNQHQIEYDNI